MIVFQKIREKRYLFVLLMLLFMGAGVFIFIFQNRGGNILTEASPDTSALQLYYFDGKKDIVRTLYNIDRKKDLIKKINDIPLEKTDESALTSMDIPFYGLWISNKDGYPISIAWSKGVWLKNNGAIYYGDRDFSSFWKQLEGEKEDDSLTVLNFPNAGRLSAYHLSFMLKVDEEVAENTDGLDILVKSVLPDEITISISNNSGEEFTYGEYYSIQKEIGGQWYALPIQEDNIGFHDIAHILPAGESAIETYDLTIFGTLESGNYKLVIETESVEFSIAG